jgi:hypothetical protein
MTVNRGIYQSRKTFHVVSEDGLRRLRVPFNPAVHKTYYPDRMFHPTWESSNFLDMFLPANATYGEFSTHRSGAPSLLDAVQEFEQIGKRGFHSTKLPVDQAHRVIYGDWDEHGSSVLVPVGCGVSKLEDIGVELLMNSENDRLKVRKYFRRIRTHHEWAVGGAVSPGYATKLGEVICGHVGGQAFDILHVDLEQLDERNRALVDGIHLVDVNLLHRLGDLIDNAKLRNMQIGDAFKGTMFAGLGMAKGFFHVVELPRYAMIIYGPKKQVRFDKFFFGSLGDVKGGQARTCIQSMGAFITDESKRLWTDQARLFIHEVMEALKSEEGLRRMVLTNIDSVTALGEGKNAEAWVLVEALKHGVPILKNPGLFRRAAQLLLTQVLDCERGRIPFGPDARRYNLQPDFSAFELETGNVDYRNSVIPEDAVCCMEVDQGPFAMYRQPLGNAKEAVTTVNIHNRRFRRFIGRDRVILGISALEQLKAMGGGDFDDAVIGTSNLSWVEVIARAEYPITPLPATNPAKLVGVPERENIYRNGGTAVLNGRTVHFEGTTKTRKYPCMWSMKDYFEAASKATEQQFTIGPIDNICRLLFLLSGVHKQNMLRDLANRVEHATDSAAKSKLQKAFNSLTAFPEHPERKVLSNEEAFIDAIKMGKGDAPALQLLVAELSDLALTVPVYPECWTWLGRLNDANGDPIGRIPTARKDAQDYVLVPSLICETLNEIRCERDMLLDALKEFEWTMVDRVPMTLNRAFPRDRGISDEAFELRSQWRKWWEPILTGQCQIQPDEARKILIDGGELILTSGKRVRIDGVRKLFYQSEDADIRLQEAVEIARQTYRTRYPTAAKDAHGNRRGFPDGLLWTNTIGLCYIQALKEAGLTGLYVPVRFDRHARHLGTGTMEVVVKCGMAVRACDGFVIGEVIGEEPPDGEYFMKDGMISIQEPSPELLQGIWETDEEFLNPVSDTFDLPV